MTTQLRLRNSCLRTLPDLSHVRVETIDIQGNRLTSLENLPISLTSLNGSHNSLLGDGIYFPFPSLKTLIISHNRVNIFDDDEFLFCFPSLDSLDISYNCVHNTGFLRNTSIREVTLSHNRLHLVTGLPQTLTKLVADTNEITMVQSKLPPALDTVELSYNLLRFAGLPLNWPPTLRELHLSHNRIEKFPRKLPESLEVLTLSHNELTELPPVLPASLQYVILSSNRIQYLPSYKNHRKFSVFLINDNCLVEIPAELNATVVQADDNWNEETHHRAQRSIKQCWKRYVLTLRLRHLIRTHRVQGELFMVSMMPERWDQVDVIDPVWFRNHR